MLENIKFSPSPLIADRSLGAGEADNAITPGAISKPVLSFRGGLSDLLIDPA